MSPFELAARSLCSDGVWEALEEAAREKLRENVRRVLRAFREPSESMIGACDSIGLEEISDDANRARRFWQTMIDDALTDGR